MKSQIFKNNILNYGTKHKKETCFEARFFFLSLRFNVNIYNEHA